ncbi:MAG: selenocysteine-specific translation elongation factor [Acidimicrobiales bacterium]
MHVVATAGHVDHGKSTLVRALTGMDPDRLAEEKARGLTIDLGFAWATLPSGRDLALVDVPGHVRFVKNMLAGVGAVDACLFVVAATEGWKPQSEEHLRILDLLGVEHAVVALTRATADDGELVDLARLDVEERLEGSALAGAPIVAVDVPAGVGLDRVVAALDDMLARTPLAADRGRPRLWIDRVFVMSGSGTVVTGTLAGGRLAVGDRLDIVPGPAPAHEPVAVRVRGLQSHREATEAVGPGHRVAVNVVPAGGADRGGSRLAGLGRGQALVRGGQWSPTTVVDATLTVLDAAPAPVGRDGRGAYHAYLGSGEHPVRLRVLGDDEVAPGATGCVRLRLPLPLPLLPGDRYVLRDAGRSATVGGGEVLDVAPVLRPSRARPDRSVDRVVAERGWIEVDRLERLTGELRQPDVAGHWVVDPMLLAETAARLRKGVTAAGDLGLDVGELDERERAVLGRLEDDAEVVVRAGRALPAEVAASGAPAAALAAHPFLQVLDAQPFSPPDPASAGVDRSELGHLVRAGLVVERDGHYFSARAVARAAEVVAGLLRQHPAGVTVSVVRSALGSTRKHVVPLLSLLDATGVTRRRGDVRIGGPHLPVPTKEADR